VCQRCFYANRRHPYTQALISAAPIPDPNLERISHRIKILREFPPLLDPSANLRFPPSRLAQGDRAYVTRFKQTADGHFVAVPYPLITLL
jgi:ABC-type oligopeptide transport system ATPase subunit